MKAPDFDTSNLINWDQDKDFQEKSVNPTLKKGHDHMAKVNTPAKYNLTGQSKMRYQVTDATGTTEWMNLRQLCRHFGFKYSAMYNRVVKKGMDIQDAVMECRDDPYTWGE